MHAPLRPTSSRSFLDRGHEWSGTADIEMCVSGRTSCQKLSGESGKRVSRNTDMESHFLAEWRVLEARCERGMLHGAHEVFQPEIGTAFVQVQGHAQHGRDPDSTCDEEMEPRLRRGSEVIARRTDAQFCTF